MATYPVTPRYRKGQSKVGPPRRWSIMHVIGPGLFCYECSKPTLPVLRGSKRRPCRQLPLQRPGFGSQLSLSGCLRWIGLHRQSREIGFREALTWSLGWIGLALLFNSFVCLKFGSKPALEFLAGYA
jgi:hypothetical protein